MIIENLSVLYKKQEILKNVCIELTSPGIYGILGANAIGKTTLFKAITGRVLFRGKVERKQSSCAYIQCEKTEVGRVYKQLIRNKSRFSIEAFNEYVQLFTIDLKLKRFDLNNEQAALLVIALTLSIESEYYLLDEPLNDLNAINRRKVLQAIIQLRDRNKVILISSHVVEDFEHVFEQLILFKKNHEVLQINSDALDYLIFNDIKEAALGSRMYLGKRQYLHHQLVKSQTVSLKQCYEALVEGIQ